MHIHSQINHLFSDIQITPLSEVLRFLPEQNFSGQSVPLLIRVPKLKHEEVILKRNSAGTVKFYHTFASAGVEQSASIIFIQEPHHTLWELIRFYIVLEYVSKDYLVGNGLPIYS